MPYRRCGRSGLLLPAISLGLWHNFGDDRPFDTQRAICGAPSTSASPTSTWPTTTARRTARPRRTSAGSWPRDFAALPRRAGDLHQGGLRHVARPVRRPRLAQVPAGLASTSRSRRLGLDYVDIFYSHRVRPGHPAGGDDGRARRPPSRRARRSTSASRPTRRERTAEAAAILRELGTPLLIHQPSYSMFNRWIEHDGLLDVAARRRAPAASRSRRWPRACSPTATCTASRRTRGRPPGGRLAPDMLTEEHLARVRALDRHRRRRAARRWPSSPWPGRCATRA